MQSLAQTPADLQHLPNGWSFPTLNQSALPPAPSNKAVTGGGASTVTRLRWGRILTLIGAGLILGFGAWSLMSNKGATKSTLSSQSKPNTVAGSGTVDIAPSTSSTQKADALPTTKSSASATNNVSKTRASNSRNSQSKTPRNRARQSTGAGLTAQGSGTANAFAIASNQAGSRAAKHNGAQRRMATSELPLTGIETWIAALLGIVILGAGIALQINAVRLATTAMLYRRGILLRPVDCARLAQERGMSSTRVFISNVLHRLLEEPAGGRDFVSARSH